MISALSKAGIDLYKFQLDLKRKARRNAIYIEFLGMTAFRLQEELMRCLIGKFHHFILDGGTVARPGTLDTARIQGRPVEVGPDNFVGALDRVGYPAWNLFHVELSAFLVIQGKDVSFQPGQTASLESEPRRRLVSQLDFTFRKVNRSSVDPAGGAGLETAYLESELPQILAQSRTRIRHPPPGFLVLAHMKKTAQERA